MSIRELSKLLAGIPAGDVSVSDSRRVGETLSQCWEDLDGHSETAMAAYKLPRMEEVTWEPPNTLRFTLERHGGTVKGSSRAELQRWTIDIRQRKAIMSSQGYRQLAERQPPVDVRRLADEVAEAICSGEEDQRLKWTPDGAEVHVQIGMMVPAGPVKQTVQDRRRRFRKALTEKLEPNGWHEVSPNKYQRRAS